MSQLPKLKIINFINAAFSEENRKAYDLLQTMATTGFDYRQVQEEMLLIGFYVPEDQYKAFEAVLDAQMDLDIGTRREEVPCV